MSNTSSSRDLTLFAGGLATGAVLGALLASRRASALAAGVRNTLPQKKRELPPLVLHLYDHCPFCIRVELVLGWKGIPYERKVYGYGDTLGSATKGLYFGGTTLTGEKQLPVLEVGSAQTTGAKQQLLPESGDIIAFVEDATGPGHVLLPPPSGRRDLRAFFDTKGAFKETARRLTRPRMLLMTHLADWAGEQDTAYARAKYEGGGFDYAAAEAASDADVAAMGGLLLQLDGMVHGEGSLNDGACGLTMDDCVYLPELRTLSCVKGVAWPAKLKAYVEDSFTRAGIDTYFDSAL